MSLTEPRTDDVVFVIRIPVSDEARNHMLGDGGAVDALAREITERARQAAPAVARQWFADHRKAAL